MESSKACYRCHQVKPLSEFSMYYCSDRIRFYNCKLCNRLRASKWYLKNRKRVLNRVKKYALLNRIKIKKYHKNWEYSRRIKEPWIYHYKSAHDRCTYSTARGFERYGGYGIKFLMTKEDFKFLWNRDKAYLLKKPSIDRENTKGHYELSNCRFIEMTENNRRKGSLSREQVIKIRSLYKTSGKSPKEIGKILGVSRGIIYHVIRRSSYFYY